MIYLKCFLCKRSRQKEIYKATFNLDKINEDVFSARRNPDGMHYRMVRCLKCGLIFSNPILEPAKIYSFYSRSKFEYPVQARYLKDTYGAYLEKLLPKTRMHLRLLDIGCGNGFFLEEAKERGIDNIYGIEPSKDAASDASKELRSKIKVSILKPKLFKYESFDIICCFHTLDHIIDPDWFVGEVCKLLKKGGKAFFVVHNVSSISVKLFGDKSPIIDIEHIYLFNPQTLSKLFKKNKFKIIEIFNLKNRYPLNYWLTMTPLPKTLKTSITKGLNITKIGFVPLSFSGGNIGIFAEK